jgi:heme exporter protein C
VTTQSSNASKAPTSTGSRGTRIIGVLALLSMAALALFGLVLSPPDTSQGEVVRILYVHVPAATFAYIGCFLTTIGSAMYLWRRSRWWELVAYASAEIATVFTAIVLVTGMIWGRPTWGVGCPTHLYRNVASPADRLPRGAAPSR